MATEGPDAGSVFTGTEDGAIWRVSGDGAQVEVGVQRREQERARVVDAGVVLAENSTTQWVGTTASTRLHGFRTGRALVVMHTRGRSKAMYQDAHYGDVMREYARQRGLKRVMISVYQQERER